MRNPIPSTPANNSISDTNNSKTTTACCAKVGVKRGPWTPEEDEKLCSYIKKEGSAVGRWRTLPKRAGLSRCGKSCRLRWMNYLRPTVKRGHIQSDEEDLILRLHRLLGNRWSLIAGRIPGRTDNEIKNYWNTHLSKKLISQGIDPRTHKPLESNNSSSNHKPSSSTPNYSQNPNPRFTSPPPSNDPIAPGQFTENYNYYQEGTDIDRYQGLDLQSSDGVRNEENEEDDSLDYCNDDVFSSFLNSIINEDAFSNNQNQIMQQQSQLVTGNNSLPQENFAFGAGWDAPIMTAFNQIHDPKRFSDDQVEKK